MMPLITLLANSSQQPVSTPSSNTPIDPSVLLNDYALPTQVSQVPALGWWLVLALIIALLSFIAVCVYQYRQARQAKNQAIQLAEKATTPAELNRVLKQTALSYLPRQQVASLNQGDWLSLQLALIPKQAATLKDELTALQNQLYQPQKTLNEQHKVAAIQWLKQAFPVNKTIQLTLSKGEQNV